VRPAGKLSQSKKDRGAYQKTRCALGPWGLERFSKSFPLVAWARGIMKKKKRKSGERKSRQSAGRKGKWALRKKKNIGWITLPVSRNPPAGTLNKNGRGRPRFVFCCATGGYRRGTISYGSFAFQGTKELLGVGSPFSDHCSLFPTAAVIEAFLERKKLRASPHPKGTIQVPPRTKATCRLHLCRENGRKARVSRRTKAKEEKAKRR